MKEGNYMSKAYFNVNPFTNPDEFIILRAARKQFIINQLESCTALTASTHDNMTFIFHPCTKVKGYQLSYFYKESPVSDIARATIPEIAEELVDCEYNVLEAMN